jgi:hypothetical protein
MPRLESALCQCGFGLLCCMSGAAMLIFGVALLVFR